MLKLGLEKREELLIKLSTFMGSDRKQGNFRKRKKKIYLCFIYYTKVFNSVDHNKLWKT